MTLVRSGFIPIPSGERAGFDHADVYRPARRLYVAHTGADRVAVLDCESPSLLRSLPDLPGVAGVVIDEPRDLLMTSDRDAARVSVFRCSDEQLLGRVAVGPHPNGLAYDRVRHRLYAFNLGQPLGEGCTASVVGLESMGVVAEIALPGRPRWAAYDAAGDLVYVNILDPAVILRIDPARNVIAGSIDVPVAGPHGLWVDGPRLYCAADGRALVVLDRESGRVEASLPLPGAPDVVWHDAEAQKLYVAVGDPGSVTVVDTVALMITESVPTEQGAHTLSWDSARKTLYVFCPGSGGAALYVDVDDDT
jgi:DNA-binding beta-propeller fold protein YncE